MSKRKKKSLHSKFTKECDTRYKPPLRSQKTQGKKAQKTQENNEKDALMSSVVFARDMLVQPSPLVGLPIQIACERFVEGRDGHLTPVTLKEYRVYSRRIGETFKRICEKKGVPYAKLKIDHMDGHWLRAYQRERGAIDVCNKELCVVRQTYYQAFERKILDYKPLAKPKDYEEPGRQLEDEERQEWKKVCLENADDPATDMCALTALASICSGMGPGEIRNLKLKNIHLEEQNPLGMKTTPFVIIPRRGAKRKSRQRKVMLFDQAVWAMAKLIDRAKNKCGSTSPDHFLVPFMNRDHSYDPTRPAGRSFWTNGMRILMAEAGVKFRFYDQRHDAMSTTLEDPRVPLAAAIAHFGWISPRMVNRYYHASDDALCTVAKALNRIPDDEPAPKKPSAKVRTSLQLVKSCSECLGEIPEAAKRCRHCGQPVTKGAAVGAD